MKWLVWLLLLVNVGLLAYFNLDRILPSAPLAKMPEINPEKIKVLSQKEIDALPKKMIEAAPVAPALAAEAVIATPASTCFEWGVFSATGLVGAQYAATKLALQATVKKQTYQEAKRFWVYKPPLKSTIEAQAKAQELQGLGVTDLFVIQEPRWRNAISFGVFEDEQLANKLVSDLKAKGIKDVVKALRDQGKGHSSLLFSNLAVNQIAELNQLKSEFPEAALKEVSCN
ncbi:MAG TPA: sporulation protein [Methylotenera sp.]|nr:sporulation protein [Methylotenera sp.]